MDPDGRPLGDILHGAVNLLDLIEKWKHNDTRGKIASFDSKQEADAIAQSYGWTVEDGNHRCPECGPMSTAGMTEQHGAYINWVADALGDN
jgi:hypothetical protein